MPVLAPDRRLQRLRAVALVDALSLLVLAGPGAVVALALREWYTAGIGIGVALCGGLELFGRHRLARRSMGGLGWLCLAQLVCLALLLLYAAHLSTQVRADHIAALLPEFTRAQLAEVFPEPGAADGFLLAIQRLMLAAVALGAVLYQGGLALYYLASRRAVRAALAEPPPLPGPPGGIAG